MSDRQAVTSANPEYVILGLLGVLLGDGTKDDRGLMNLIINGRQHVPRCPFGQWLTQGGPRPEGDSCSERCVKAWDAIRVAADWLKAHEDRPLLDAAPLPVEQQANLFDQQPSHHD